MTLNGALWFEDMQRIKSHWFYLYAINIYCLLEQY